MFQGPNGKRMMIQQGYVPQTCTLPDEIAGPIIWDAINKGKSPCWECNGVRTVCKGQTKREPSVRVFKENSCTK